MNESVCTWKRDEWHDCYEAACGTTWWFYNTDSVNFCPNCGNPVRIQDEIEGVMPSMSHSLGCTCEDCIRTRHFGSG